MTTTLSLASVLAEPARRRPEHLALVERETRLTYRQVYERVVARAAHLTDLGVAPGDRVALLAPNVIGFVVDYYAILFAGGVVVPVPTLLTAREVGHIILDAAASVILAHDRQRAVAERAVAGTGTGTRVEPLAGNDSAAAAAASAAPGFVPRNPSDAAVILYTSGTTGVPKGAVLSHLNLVMNATVNAVDAVPIARDEVVLGCLPLYHTFGQTVAMNATFRMGATLVLQRRFDAVAAIELMAREGVTLFAGVPTMYARLADAAGDAPISLPQLQRCICGGASLPVTLLKRFQTRFDVTIHEGYGLSETSPTATTNQTEFGFRAGTVGHSLWGVDVEIADPNIDDAVVLLPCREIGEVVIRGHNVFGSYLDNPEATKQAVIDGWFRTGDLGRKDDDGFLWIVDRKKDLIIRNGFNVYPSEVEQALTRHPSVGQVAVIGIPDERVGEEVWAVVVPRTGCSVDATELFVWAQHELGRHKYPRQIVITDALPLGPSHKVLKRELRRRLSTETI